MNEKDANYIRAMISPYYYENIRAWVLNNMEIKEPEDIPAIFGEHSPMQNFFERDMTRLLFPYRKEKE